VTDLAQRHDFIRHETSSVRTVITHLHVCQLTRADVASFSTPQVLGERYLSMSTKPAQNHRMNLLLTGHRPI
jgi:hypothetical protein